MDKLSLVQQMARKAHDRRRRAQHLATTGNNTTKKNRQTPLTAAAAYRVQTMVPRKTQKQKHPSMLADIRKASPLVPATHGGLRNIDELLANLQIDQPKQDAIDEPIRVSDADIIKINGYECKFLGIARQHNAEEGPTSAPEHMEQARIILLIKLKNEYPTITGKKRNWMPFYISSGLNSGAIGKGALNPIAGFIRHNPLTPIQYQKSMFKWDDGRDPAHQDIFWYGMFNLVRNAMYKTLQSDNLLAKEFVNKMLKTGGLKGGGWYMKCSAWSHEFIKEKWMKWLNKIEGLDPYFETKEFKKINKKIQKGIKKLGKIFEDPTYPTPTAQNVKKGAWVETQDRFTIPGMGIGTVTREGKVIKIKRKQVDPLQANFGPSYRIELQETTVHTVEGSKMKLDKKIVTKNLFQFKFITSPANTRQCSEEFITMNDMMTQYGPWSHTPMDANTNYNNYMITIPLSNGIQKRLILPLINASEVNIKIGKNNPWGINLNNVYSLYQNQANAFLTEYKTIIPYEDSLGLDRGIQNDLKNFAPSFDEIFYSLTKVSPSIQNEIERGEGGSGGGGHRLGSRYGARTDQSVNQASVLEQPTGLYGGIGKVGYYAKIYHPLRVPDQGGFAKQTIEFEDVGGVPLPTTGGGGRSTAFTAGGGGTPVETSRNKRNKILDLSDEELSARIRNLGGGYKKRTRRKKRRRRRRRRKTRKR